MNFLLVGDLGQGLLLLIHTLFPSLVDGALGIGHNNILGPMLQEQFTDANAGCPNTCDHNLDILNFLAGDLEGIY